MFSSYSVNKYAPISPPFISYVNKISNRTRYNTPHYPEPIHCPQCLYIFSSKTQFIDHNNYCIIGKSASMLSEEDYYNPLTSNFPKHRCNVLLDTVNRNSEPCFQLLIDNECIYHGKNNTDSK